MSAEKARKLIALATDPATTEAEARTVALQACLVIAKEGLFVVDSDQDYWDRATIDIAASATCTNVDTAANWADKLSARRQERLKRRS